ncbi:hypothetical protein Pst134EA_021276 [Puccinia striiformis f. sp. tritici]|uniref:hypothetical protein n=1 Tax=Puccinia striiformis f. sp. tritici TaxID=168172 RepID=UPI002007FB67|nr:hypothetical protein Pst134EA_021276 [Puccinia striiformis f. sp. tritici]KAH9457400.1 hypothetical protein Pst134EA_021276 [Puccinia striiformis f. sp. tritici]
MCLFTRPAGFRAGRNFLSSHPLDLCSGFRSRINQKTSTQELFWLGHAEPDLTDIKCWLQKNFAAARFSTQVPQSNLGKRRGRHRNASSCESRSARSQYNDQSRRDHEARKTRYAIGNTDESNQLGVAFRRKLRLRGHTPGFTLPARCEKR